MNEGSTSGRNRISRRSLIRGAALAGAGLLVPPSAAEAACQAVQAEQTEHAEQIPRPEPPAGPRVHSFV